MGDTHTIRWGIIGCGDVTEVKSGPALQKAAGSSLVAVMRRSADKAQDYARRHGVPRWYADAQQLIDDPEVDAVYVATPPGSHAEYAIRALRAGKPTYVEKPMARDFAECEQILAASREAGVPLFVAYYRRRLPRILRVKQLIDDGVIGDVRFVQHTLFQRPNPKEKDRTNLPWQVIAEQSGGGRFLDLASHALDTFDFLFGPIEEATGRAANQAGLYDVEDIVLGQWRHTGNDGVRGGVLGSCVYCFTTFDRVDRCEVIGSKGVLSFKVLDAGPIELWNAEGRQSFDEPNPPHVQQPLVQSVVDELLGRGKCPSTGESAARSSRVMDQMLAGYRREALRQAGRQ